MNRVRNMFIVIYENYKESFTHIWTHFSRKTSRFESKWKLVKVKMRIALANWIIYALQYALGTT